MTTEILTAEEVGPTPEALAAFRQEIAQIANKEKTKKITSGHFSDVLKPELVLKIEDLDKEDYYFWVKYKDCLRHPELINDFVEEYRIYESLRISQDGEDSLAKEGLYSYIMNTIGSLGTSIEYDEKKLKRGEDKWENN
ncbi:MAG: hypothetical protein WC385_03315 [Candidatus Paceibacterota bacterium]|jgi:hypothetical protein